MQYLQKGGSACPWVTRLQLSSFALLERPARCIYYSLFALKVFSNGVCTLVVLLRETTKVCTNASKTLSQKSHTMA